MPVIKSGLIPRVSVTLQLSADRAVEITNIAKATGVARHTLLIRAVDAGFPFVLAELAQAAAAAIQQQQG